MIKLIVGTKGSGKTKTMIDMINEATKTATGNVVVIEKSMQLTTSINHAARLVDVDEYKINNAEMLYGFVAGVLAGNYDITNLFIDGILKICGQDLEAAGRVLDALNERRRGQYAREREEVPVILSKRQKQGGGNRKTVFRRIFVLTNRSEAVILDKQPFRGEVCNLICKSSIRPPKSLILRHLRPIFRGWISPATAFLCLPAAPLARCPRTRAWSWN